MSRTRLTALALAVGLGAAGLAPAGAADAPDLALQVSPAQAAHAALSRLLDAPDPARLTAWRAAQRPVLMDEGTDAMPSSSEGEAEFAWVSEAGDVDGDRRPDVLVQRDEGFVLRSGRTGAALLRRPSGWLWGVTSGRVRALVMDVTWAENGRSYDVTHTVEALDARAKRVWTWTHTGTVSGSGFGPAYLGRAVDLPMVLGEQRDEAGRPLLMMGRLSATETSATTTSNLTPLLISVADGTETALPVVRGAGRGYAHATEAPAPPDSRSCYVATAPLASFTRVALSCDGAPLWSATVRLRDPYVQPAGDFDADGAPDLQVATYGFGRPTARELLRGTRILALTDGSELASSAVDGLSPVRADVDRDGQPDFLEVLFEEGMTAQVVHLDGTVVHRSSVDLTGSGSISGLAGPDVTGDGAGDALLVLRPERGDATTVVLDARSGRTARYAGVDDLVWPGLRRAGMDLRVDRVEKGQLRTTVLSGDRGRTLLDVRVAGPAGAVRAGGAGSADLDGDGRRDLVVASRAGNRHLTTAFSATGRRLWQTSDAAPPLGKGPGFVIVYG